MGAALLSVIFVEDYVQLRWSTHTITAYTLPKFLGEGPQGDVTNPRYRQDLLRLEGQEIRGAEAVPGEHVSLQFADARTLEISLRDAEYRGPEALKLDRQDHRATWVA